MRASNLTVGITGAAGFIGSRLAPVLEAAGHDVRATCHNVAKPPSQGLEHRRLDVRDADNIAEVFDGVDVVVHLASVTGVKDCDLRPDDAFQVNVQGTANVAWFCRRLGIPLIFASSVAAIGRPSNQVVGPDEPLTPTSLYGLTKAIAEETVERLSHDHFTVSVLRIANVFGAYPSTDLNHRSVVDLFLQQAVEDGTITVHAPGTQRRDFVYVEDVVEAFALAVERAKTTPTGSTVYPVATGTSRTILGVAEIVREAVEQRGRGSPHIEIIEHDGPHERVPDFEFETTPTVETLSFQPKYDIETAVEELLDRSS